jgi:electron transfer flavoprotein alpha subunit
MSTNNEVWVWAEQRNGRLMDVSLQILGKAIELSKEIGGTTAAVLLGNDVRSLAEELIAYGADKVYVFSDPQLAYYQSGAYTRLIGELVAEKRPEIMLLGATTIGMDLAPSVAAMVKTGLTAHCCGLEIDKGGNRPKLIAAVPGWGGGMIVNILCPNHVPQMATVSPGVSEKPARAASENGVIIPINVVFRESDFRARTVEMVEEIPQGIQIEEADVVVSGGYGMKSSEGLKSVEELAKILGAAVGGTRRALDEGWIRENSLVGVSGRIISPKLLITLGASGANHYTAGFVKAGKVLAVNNDPKAPIFDVCDIGIVGDLHEVLPVLVDKLKNL